MLLEWLHSLPSLAKFALGMAIIVGIPPLSRRARLPAVVGLLLSGVVLGPHVLGFFGEHAPIADFFAELGKLLLMFFASVLRSTLRSLGENETNRPSSVSLLL
jgi:Kef-type K+ transport system membrane component KefB